MAKKIKLKEQVPELEDLKPGDIVLYDFSKYGETKRRLVSVEDVSKTTIVLVGGRRFNRLNGCQIPRADYQNAYINPLGKKTLKIYQEQIEIMKFRKEVRALCETYIEKNKTDQKALAALRRFLTKERK